jgi:hypothetical protein
MQAYVLKRCETMHINTSDNETEAKIIGLYIWGLREV